MESKAKPTEQARPRPSAKAGGVKPGRVQSASIALDDGPSPLYQRVKQQIVQKIEGGEWLPDQRIPSENELVADLGISRMTIHRALRELSAEGVLVRVHGVGTFVRGAVPQAPLMEIRNIADEIAARGHAHSTLVLKQEAVMPSGPIAAIFGMAERTSLFHTVLIHRENDLPIQLEDRYVAPDLVPHYLEQDFTRITAHEYLMQQAPFSEGEHIIQAVTAEAWERKELQIARDEPCLLVRRRTWATGGMVSYARLLYPGSRYQLGGRFQGRGGNS